ncbi:MAG TPA: lectin-like protein, partial [Planctomycetota bacterium]|nr:lectin-like protein [Planctomycetota bacterium]
SLASATTPRLPSPNPPSSLVATAVIASEVDLSWTDNSTNETGFRIERRRYHEPLPGGAVPSRNDANGNHYAFIAGPILPLDARAAAAGLVFLGTPGHCVTITSWLEQDFMSTVFVDLGWIGGTDEVVEGTWRWVGGPEDGETFEQAGFSFWAPGEPNNAGGNENYACIGFANLSWNDYSAGQILSGYYVEFETGSITDVDFAPIATVGPDVTSFADKTAVSGVSYEYRVIAIGSLASSDPSNTIAVAVP